MKRGPGRPKGSINKTTASVKAALIEAFEKMGGVKSLLKWGRSEPTEFYKLWAKMLPTDVEASIKGKIEIRIQFEDSWTVGDARLSALGENGRN